MVLINLLLCLLIFLSFARIESGLDKSQHFLMFIHYEDSLTFQLIGAVGKVLGKCDVSITQNEPSYKFVRSTLPWFLTLYFIT